MRCKATAATRRAMRSVALVAAVARALQEILFLQQATAAVSNEKQQKRATKSVKYCCGKAASVVQFIVGLPQCGLKIY